MTTQHDHCDEGYDGPAELAVGDAGRLAVSVTLRGVFQPIDGRYHWYGRAQQSDELDDAAGRGATAHLRTPHGSAEGRLSDRDPWGRYRVAGVGRPPFPTD